MKLGVALERLAIVVCSLALSVGLIALLSGYFAGRDQAGVSGSAAGIGATFADQGNAVLRPGQPRPRYDSDPPTSGPHQDVPIESDGLVLSDDQLLEALSLGDVVVMYASATPPAGLTALADRIAGPFTPSLAAAGDAIILARRPGTDGVIALAWTHMLHVRAASDPTLAQFANAWLGRGAPGIRG